jgi:hypothetical protein
MDHARGGRSDLGVTPSAGGVSHARRPFDVLSAMHQRSIDTVTHSTLCNDVVGLSQVRTGRTDTTPEQQFGAHHAASAEIKSRGRASSAR